MLRRRGLTKTYLIIGVRVGSVTCAIAAPEVVIVKIFVVFLIFDL